jgi:exopolysaccharide biosynthesis operon protein EpsL
MRAKPLAALALLSLAPVLVPPASAQSIPSTDEVMWPQTGRFAAYPPDRLQARGLRFFVHGALHRDSNIFRLADDANTQALLGTSERSDTVRRLGAGVRADIPISLQHLSLEASVEDNDFERFDQLDYVGHRLSGVWRWQVGSQLRGDVGAQTRKTLGGYGDVQDNARNLVTENRAFASAGYMLTPRWRVRGGLHIGRIEHDNPARAAQESRTTTTTLGVDYVTPAASSVGAQVRFTNGEAPSRQIVGATPVNNDYDQVQTSLVARWLLTPKTSVDGRLGYTRRTHDQLPGRDFKGATGRIGMDWAATPKTHLNAAAWREVQPFRTVIETTTMSIVAPPGVATAPGEFAGPAPQPVENTTAETVATYMLAQGFSVGPSWAPTEKLVVQARLLYEKQDFKGDPGVVLAVNPRREETFRGMSLAFGYAPLRSLLLALAFQSGQRDSNVALRGYDFNTVTLSGRFTF